MLARDEAAGSRYHGDLAGTIFALLFVAGVRLRYLGLAGIAGCDRLDPHHERRLPPGQIPVVPLALERSAERRVPPGQSYIALGSGGLFGVGLGASRQKWMYVPNAHTDFIFSILGEELGLLVAICVLGLFAVLLYGGTRVAARAPDTFGRLLASGIVAWLGLQTIVNLGAVTVLLPITGVPLPAVLRRFLASGDPRGDRHPGQHRPGAGRGRAGRKDPT